GPGATVVMNDINPLALRYTAINAAAAGVPIETSLGDALSSSSGAFDLVVCNPPYLVDDGARVYRHGGDRLGRGLAIRIAEESLARLRPGGRLLLYTGVAILDGRDPFIDDLRPSLEAAGAAWTYRELDPDVFGEELERPIYAEIDRIAAVGLVVDMPA
ncbi:MAG: methyltransferase, partial [Myxococcales bacterium]|nr:methyltransferase [Myxococcales bacterium]